MERHVYGGVNAPVAGLIPADRRRVLDLGCGDGSFGRWLKQQGSDWVTGVTIQDEEARRAASGLDEVICTDLDRWDPVGERYDGVVASHVLEHLADPSTLLQCGCAGRMGGCGPAQCPVLASTPRVPVGPIQIQQGRHHGRNPPAIL